MEIKVYLKCSSMPLVADLNLNALADVLKVPQGSLKIITPEEYAAATEEE